MLKKAAPIKSGRLLYKRLFGRRSTLLLLSGFPLVIPSACGRCENYHLKQPFYLTIIIPYLLFYVKRYKITVPTNNRDGSDTRLFGGRRLSRISRTVPLGTSYHTIGVWSQRNLPPQTTLLSYSHYIIFIPICTVFFVFYVTIPSIFADFPCR